MKLDVKLEAMKSRDAFAKTSGKFISIPVARFDSGMVCTHMRYPPRVSLSIIADHSRSSPIVHKSPAKVVELSRAEQSRLE